MTRDDAVASVGRSLWSSRCRMNRYTPWRRMSHAFRFAREAFFAAELRGANQDSVIGGRREDEARDGQSARPRSLSRAPTAGLRSDRYGTATRELGWDGSADAWGGAVRTKRYVRAVLMSGPKESVVGLGDACKG